MVSVAAETASPSRPVFYYRDPLAPRRLDAYDWNGKHSGYVEVTASPPFGAYPSPDGTRILLRAGRVVAGGRVLGKVSLGTWAGDDQNLCGFLNELGGIGAHRERSISPNETQGIDTPGWLFVQAVGGRPRRVVRYGSFGAHGAPEVLACNARKDLAVVAQTGYGVPNAGPQLVRLSTGASRGLGQGPREFGAILVSDDGTRMAVADDSAGTAHFSDFFSVREIPDGPVIARVAGGMAVAFSGDNTRVLTVHYLDNSTESGRYQVVDLATGRVVWSAVLSPGTHLTRPGGGEFLVASRTYEPSKVRGNASAAFDDVWLVPVEGPARMILQHVAPVTT